MRNIKEILRLRGLRYKELYIFQSRVTGTCKLSSDLDIYVQLADEHFNLVEGQGEVFCGIKVLKTPIIMRNIDHKRALELGTVKPPIYLDITAGLAKEPPRKPKYKNVRYYINLRELASLASSQK